MCVVVGLRSRTAITAATVTKDRVNSPLLLDLHRQVHINLLKPKTYIMYRQL